MPSVWWGDFYFRAQKFDQAFATFGAGIGAQPGQKAMFQKKQVELLSLQNKRAEAVALAQKVVDENKDDAEAKAIRASLKTPDIASLISATTIGWPALSSVSWHCRDRERMRR